MNPALRRENGWDVFRRSAEDLLVKTAIGAVTATKLSRFVLISAVTSTVEQTIFHFVMKKQQMQDSETREAVLFAVRVPIMVLEIIALNSFEAIHAHTTRFMIVAYSIRLLIQNEGWVAFKKSGHDLLVKTAIGAGIIVASFPYIQLDPVNFVMISAIACKVEQSIFDFVIKRQQMQDSQTRAAISLAVRIPIMAVEVAALSLFAISPHLTPLIVLAYSIRLLIQNRRMAHNSI